MLNIHTGQVIPAMCQRLSCTVCVRVMAFKYGAAIGLARPDDQVLLTQVGMDWSSIKKRMNQFRKNLRQMDLRSEDVYHVERNPGGGGNCHVHMWRWGDPLDEPTVQKAAARAGMGQISNVTPRQRPAGAPLTYGMKVVIGGPPTTPDGALPPSTDDYLTVNGRWLAHASRGFWRDENGIPLGGVGAAMAQAAQQSGSGAWVTTSLELA